MSWLRQLKSGELFYLKTTRANVFKMRYAITLNSKVELEEQTVQLALETLYRKVPTLRLCIREKEGEMWFHEMEKMKIDFQKNASDNYAIDFENIVSYPYDEPNGPLWCAYLYPSPTGAECPMPSVGKEFPIQYNFLFGIHHSITDGMTNIRICGAFVDFLNLILEGKIVDSIEQIGFHCDGHETVELIESFKKELKTQPKWATPLESFLSDYDIDLLTNYIFPPKSNLQPCTKAINYTMNENQTSNLITRCSKEGVTVNSAFSVAANFAFYQIFKERYPGNQTFPIPHIHHVNARRYWSKTESFPLGCHNITIACKSNVDTSCVIDNFWQHARSYHKNLKSQLDDIMPLRHLAFKILNGTADDRGNLHASIDSTDMLRVYYVFSNLGNLSSSFPGTGNIVQATYFNRGIRLRQLVNCFFFHTFRGQFMINYSYGEELMPEEGAQKISDRIFQVLLDAVNM